METGRTNTMRREHYVKLDTNGNDHERNTPCCTLMVCFMLFAIALVAVYFGIFPTLSNHFYVIGDTGSPTFTPQPSVDYTTTTAPRPTPKPTYATGTTTTSSGGLPTTASPATFPTTPSPVGLPTTPSYSSPSSAPTTHESDNSDADIFASYSSDDVNVPVVIGAGIFCGVGLLISIVCLFIFCIPIREESSRWTMTNTLKQMGCKDKAFLILKIFDTVTDFLFASDLLLQYDYNPTISVLGWVCFISGIFGVILMYVKLLLMQMALYQITDLRTQKENLCVTKSATDPEIKKKTKEIRDRNSAILFMDLLTVSLEDCPQVTISFLISLYTGFENELALLSLAVSLACIFWTPVAVIVNCCGLADDGATNRAPHVGGRGRTQEMQHINNNSTEHNEKNEWEVLYTKDGRIYYQNNVTKKTQWENPFGDE
eukprot:11063_1